MLNSPLGITLPRSQNPPAGHRAAPPGHRSPSKAGTARLGGTRGPPDITGAALGCRVTTEGRLNPRKSPALPAALLN